MRLFSGCCLLSSLVLSVCWELQGKPSCFKRGRAGGLRDTERGKEECVRIVKIELTLELLCFQGAETSLSFFMRNRISQNPRGSWALGMNQNRGQYRKLRKSTLSASHFFFPLCVTFSASQTTWFPLKSHSKQEKDSECQIKGQD